MTNLSISNIQFAGGSGHLAYPAHGGPYPGLLVFQEWWGLNDHIRDVTERLAREGFTALAVDMYDGKTTKDPAEASRLMTAMDPAATRAKLQGALEYLMSSSLVVGGRTGAIGFCLGGLLSMNLAASNKNLRAAAAFYGKVPPDASLGGISAPLLYFYGEKDHHIPSADIDRLAGFLKQRGNAGGVVRYPNSEHAFLNDTRQEVYNPIDAKDAWSKAVSFLKKHLAD